ncbi:MAG: transporter [Gammaproteobacteria bacterium]|nr:transporter [Gammaproteobacteria bacterium]
MKKWFVSAVTFYCANLSGIVCAADIEHGKVNTGDPSTVDPGHYEIEFEYDYFKANRAFDENGNSVDRGSFHERDMALVLTVGLVENWDIYFGLPVVRIEDEDSDPNRGSGVADAEFGGRFRFINNETSHLEIAYTAGFIAPIGSDDSEDEIGTSQQYWSLEQALILSKDWERWTMNAELGYSLPFGKHRDAADGSVSLNTAIGYQITPTIQPELELNYGRDFTANETDAKVLSVTAGLVMPVNDMLLVKAGVVKDVSGTYADKTTLYLLNIKLVF